MAECSTASSAESDNFVMLVPAESPRLEILHKHESYAGALHSKH